MNNLRALVAAASLGIASSLVAMPASAQDFEVKVCPEGQEAVIILSCDRVTLKCVIIDQFCV